MIYALCTLLLLLCIIIIFIMYIIIIIITIITTFRRAFALQSSGRHCPPAPDLVL